MSSWDIFVTLSIIAGSPSVDNSEPAKGKSAAGPSSTPRMLVRTAELFRFRISLSLPPTSTVPLEIRVDSKNMGNMKMPRFLKTDFAAAASAGTEKRVVEFSGVPLKRDIGEFNVGVYERGSDACVGRVLIEVAEAAR